MHSITATRRAVAGPNSATATARLVAVMLCISIAGAVSAMVWTGPRVYYAMARDGVFPRIFSETQHKGGTPGKSIILQSVWVTLLIVSGTFEQLVIYGGLALNVFSALAVSTVLVLRWRSPTLARPYRVPLYPLVPLLYVAASVWIVTHTAIERPTESLLAVATVLAGTPFFLMKGMLFNYKKVI